MNPGIAVHRVDLRRPLRWFGVSALVAVAVVAGAVAIPLVLYGLVERDWPVVGGAVLCGATGIGSLLLAERLLGSRAATPKPLYPDETDDEARVGGIVAGAILYGFLSLSSLLLLFGAGLTGQGGNTVAAVALLLPVPGLLLAAVSYLVGKR